MPRAVPWSPRLMPCLVLLPAGVVAALGAAALCAVSAVCRESCPGAHAGACTGCFSGPKGCMQGPHPVHPVNSMF